MKVGAKGARREREARDILQELGYRVTRSGGSLGEWDLIGISASRILLVQVKSNRWPGVQEMERMRAFRVPDGVKRQVWRFDDRCLGNPIIREIL